mgnify:CR=1 FL=1
MYLIKLKCPSWFVVGFEAFYSGHQWHPNTKQYENSSYFSLRLTLANKLQFISAIIITELVVLISWAHVHTLLVLCFPIIWLHRSMKQVKIECWSKYHPLSHLLVYSNPVFIISQSCAYKWSMKSWYIILVIICNYGEIMILQLPHQCDQVTGTTETDR